MLRFVVLLAAAASTTTSVLAVSLRGASTQRATATCYSKQPNVSDTWCTSNGCNTAYCVAGTAPTGLQCVATGGWTNTWCMTHGCPTNYCKLGGDTCVSTVSNVPDSWCNSNGCPSPTCKVTSSSTSGTQTSTPAPTTTPTSSTTTTVTTTPAPTKPPTPPPTTSSTSGATTGTSTTTTTTTTTSGVLYAPYVDITLSVHWSSAVNDLVPQDLSAIADASGGSIKRYTLAFITNSGTGCLPTWGGQAAYPATGAKPWGKTITDNLLTKGVNFAVSFGGASGIDIAETCDVNGLVSAYQSVIDNYKPERLDFDIEGAFQTNAAAQDKMFTALKTIQTKNPNVKLSLTLPVMPWGLTNDGKAVAQRAYSKGLDFQVNIMAMDYGGPTYSGPQGDNAIAAATSLVTYLKTLWPTKTEAQVYSAIWVCPMIGVNDVVDEIFDLNDATKLRNWAVSKNIAGLTMWAVNRDHPCGGGVFTTCSGGNVQTADYDFSKRLAGVGTGTSTTTTTTSTPTPTTAPTLPPTTTATSGTTTAPTSTGSTTGSTTTTTTTTSGVLYAPYIDTTLNVHWSSAVNDLVPQDLSAISDASGGSIKRYTLAFITNGGTGCQPAWGGVSSYPATGAKPWGKTVTDALLAKGVKFAISFGGASGTDISEPCDVNGLVSAYQSVIDTYKPERLDFDIEGAFQTNTAAQDKMFTALKTIQSKNPNVKLSLTLPVMPYGLTNEGKAVVKRAGAKALDFQVNIMAMDYGGSYSGAQGDNAISAATALATFLKTVWTTKTEAQVYNAIWVCPMIGVNDVVDEIFSLADAIKLRNWAVSKNIAGLTMWSVNRDHACPGGVSITCSGGNVQTGDYDFSKRLSGLVRA